MYGTASFWTVAEPNLLPRLSPILISLHLDQIKSQFQPRLTPTGLKKDPRSNITHPAMSSSRGVENGESTTTLDSPAGKSASRGNNKRSVDEAPAPASPVRRSKRFKSSDALDGSQNTQSRTSVKGEEVINQSPRSRVSKKKSEKPEGTSLKTEVKEEEEEAELSVDVTSKKAQQDKEKPDEKTTVTAKISRKRKTKEEKEIEMQPLAARTTGLRMFVGAHVSAAKGKFPCLDIRISDNN